MSDRKVFSLLQLCTAIQRQIEAATQSGPYWVKAEIAQINHQRHVYMELVQHVEGRRVAVLRGIIWQPTMRGIREALGDELPHVLKEGAEVLLQASVQYHPVHGLALHILAVDLSYSLGELERRKQAALAALRNEGLFDLNRSLPEPLVMQRIALVTSPGSAAYSDFMQHLAANEYGYRFHVKLFAAAVQGITAPLELRKALEAIDPQAFDAVVLIRGGGSKLDLEAFNDLDLCRALARMPVPVLTGIGHDVDVSVADLIAHGAHKTPTAVADHLVDKCLYFETGLNSFLVRMQRTVGDAFSARKEAVQVWSEQLRQRPRSLVQEQRSLLQHGAQQFSHRAHDLLQRTDRALERQARDLVAHAGRRIKEHERPALEAHRASLDQLAHAALKTMVQRVGSIQETIALLDPERVMAKGFSITRHHGAVVKDAAQLVHGDVLETTFAQGTVRSIVQEP